MFLQSLPENSRSQLIIQKETCLLCFSTNIIGNTRVSSTTIKIGVLKSICLSEMCEAVKQFWNCFSGIYFHNEQNPRDQLWCGKMERQNVWKNAPLFLLLESNQTGSEHHPQSKEWLNFSTPIQSNFLRFVFVHPQPPSIFAKSKTALFFLSFFFFACVWPFYNHEVYLLIRSVLYIFFLIFHSGMKSFHHASILVFDGVYVSVCVKYWVMNWTLKMKTESEYSYLSQNR